MPEYFDQSALLVSTQARMGGAPGDFPRGRYIDDKRLVILAN
jgi:hypothetical protein